MIFRGLFGIFEGDIRGREGQGEEEGKDGRKVASMWGL